MIWFSLAPGQIRAFGEELNSLTAARFVAATSGKTALVANLVVGQFERLLDIIDGLQGFGVLNAEVTTMG